MQTRKLGYSDLELTTVGLGTWAIGGAWLNGWGEQDDSESIAAIHRAIELGINWIDTAPIYGRGHSEEVVGKAIKGRRDKVFVATKCNRFEDIQSSQLYGDLSAASLKKEVEDSLRRLGVDVIDLYQIHWPIPDEDIEQGWAALADMVKEGKVRYIGVSNFSVEQLKRVQPIHPVTSLQPPYSMLKRDTESTMAYCAENNIGMLAYSPMQAGLLTGKFTKAGLSALDPGDWRLRNEHFQEPQLSINLDFVEKLRPIAARNERSLAELSIAWVLRRPEITAAIVGARRPSQIEGTAPAGDWTLSAEDIADINALLAQRDKALAQVK